MSGYWKCSRRIKLKVFCLNFSGRCLGIIEEKKKEVSFIMPKKDEYVQLERLKLCSKNNGECGGCKFYNQCANIHFF